MYIVYRSADVHATYSVYIYMYSLQTLYMCLIHVYTHIYIYTCTYNMYIHVLINIILELTYKWQPLLWVVWAAV